MLKKVLRTEVSTIYDDPIIKVEVDSPSGRPRWVFVFNPFYKGTDPMKQIIWGTYNADGTKGFVRNPFAPGAEYGYDHTTAEKTTESKFNPGNIDPYFE